MLNENTKDTKFDDIISEDPQDREYIARKEVVRPEKENKLISLKQMILILIATCWFAPILIIFIVMSITYRDGMIQKTESLLMDDVKNFSTTISYSINETINLSKNVSYEQQLEKEWKNYENDVINRAEFYRMTTSIIGSKFNHDNRFKDAVFYLVEEPGKLYPTTPQELSMFSGEIVEVAHDITKQDTPKAFVEVVDGKMYVIRNLYAIQGYRKFGTLILELNTDKLFKDISKNDIYDIGFYIDEKQSIVTHKMNLIEDNSKEEILDKVRKNNGIDNNKIQMIVSENKKYVGYAYQKKQKDYQIQTVLIVDQHDILSEIKTLYHLMALLILVMIPIFAYVIYFITKNVSNPIVKLVAASKEIRSGNIGIQIDGDKKTMPNREFAYLMVSFNKMSSKIKYLFDYAYNEQLAKKDAKIMALQSQINPHFLNNTLEMMNWQARMAGDINVTKMIEALSTLLDYSMDRSNRRRISLADEIHCADAYFYIISMRFGKRLQVKKDIDESLLQIQVPQLILQPLLENAVVHGVEQIKSGTIWLNVWRDKETVQLQVINTGKDMNQEDTERINVILSRENQIVGEKGKYVSLGIRNVNERIKLIYGEAYGLTIKPVEKGITAATISIPYLKEDVTNKD